MLEITNTALNCTGPVAVKASLANTQYLAHAQQQILNLNQALNG